MRTTADYLALITQAYKDQPKFTAMVEAFVAPAAKMQELAASLPAAFDLDTAVGRQLDAVGLWVGRTRNVFVPIEGVFFTWDDTAADGWDAGVWQGEFEAGASLTVLTDALFRKVLMGKVAANNWKGDREGQYRTLTEAFGMPGAILILDHQDMSQTVLINTGALTEIERALLVGGYIPVKPAGVRINFEDYFLPPFEAAIYLPEKPAAGQIFGGFEVLEHVTLGEGDWLTARADLEFADDATFLIRRNGVEIGSVLFAGGAPAPVTGTVALLEDGTLLVPGDFVDVEAPDPADTTGGEITLALYGQRIPII